METTKQKIQRTFSGKVVSTAMNKTITVMVNEMKLNKKYQKKYRVSKKYHVHDESGAGLVGDAVTFVECRPISKTKRWRLLTAKK
jgi:small subunit ribosomal protein S17